MRGTTPPRGQLLRVSSETKPSFSKASDQILLHIQAPMVPAPILTSGAEHACRLTYLLDRLEAPDALLHLVVPFGAVHLRLSE